MQKIIKILFVLIVSTLLNASTNWAPVVMGDIMTFVPYNKMLNSNQIDTISAQNTETALTLSMSGIFEKGSHASFFIDADNDSSTGYSEDTVRGADYLIQGTTLYRHDDSTHGWKWDKISVTGSSIQTGNTITSTIPLNMMDIGDTIKFIASISLPNWKHRKNYKNMVAYKMSGNNTNYIYGKMGKYNVVITPSSKDSRSVIYHPKSWNTTPTPIVFFTPGFRGTDHKSYKKLLEFVASHGYSVVYVPDSGSYYSQFQKMNTFINTFSHNLDKSKIGVLGHSSGGGAVYYFLKLLNEKGYGENGRFICAMGSWIAQFMDKQDIKSLTNTNALIVQFGNNGKGDATDPRVVLTTYRLLSGEGIDKNYLILDGPSDADHGYPGRQDIHNMQGLLQPLDALMEYTFKNKSNAHHAMALEGEGKVNPYANAYQKVLSINQYGKSSCIEANKYHKGSDGKTKSTIDNCGVPKILPN